MSPAVAQLAPSAGPSDFRAWGRPARLHLLQRLTAQRYWHDPTAWVHDFIDWPDGDHIAPYQEEVLGEIPARQRVSVRGPHGLGKTTTMALGILWFSTTREMAGADWKIPTTASEWRQLREYLWPEVHRWARFVRWGKLGLAPWHDGAELLTLGIKLDHGAAFALASKDPAAIEGAHADQLMYVFDEAKAIVAATFDAAEGAFSNAGIGGREAYALAFSTPGPTSGRFYDIHHRAPGLEDWWPRHVTLQEVVAAGRVGEDWAEQRGRQWGIGSALYANRVLGEFAADQENAVVPLAWLEAAIERGKALKDEVDAGTTKLLPLTALGVDVANGSGNDETVLAPRHRHVIAELRASAYDETMETAGRVAGILSAHREAYAAVDVIGVGDGVARRLLEQGFDVELFNASSRVDDTDASGELGFINRRALAWWHFRELLDPTNGLAIAIFPDPEDLLLSDLTAPTWRVTSTGGGRIQIEAKADIVRRLGRSPDRGDAVIMAFAPRMPQGGMVVYDDPVQIGPDI